MVYMISKLITESVLHGHWDKYMSMMQVSSWNALRPIPLQARPGIVQTEAKHNGQQYIRAYSQPEHCLEYDSDAIQSNPLWIGKPACKSE